MPNPKLIQILRSKTRLSDEEIIGLTDAQGWKAIREAGTEQKTRREAVRKPEICFTGFGFEEREELETQAVIKGLKVRKSVTKDLAYLVLGETPGEKKIEKAVQQGVEILRLDDYERLEAFIRKPRKIKKDKPVRTTKKVGESADQAQESKKYQSSVELRNDFEPELLADAHREAMLNLEIINTSPDSNIQSIPNRKATKSPYKSWLIWAAWLFLLAILSHVSYVLLAIAFFMPFSWILKKFLSS